MLSTRPCFLRRGFSLLVIPCFLFSAAFIFAQNVNIYSRPENFERNRDYDAVHYRLKFRFDVGTKVYWGENRITLAALSDGLEKCVLDAEDFLVSAVLDQNEKPLRYEQTEKQLIVEFPRSLGYLEKTAFTVKYSGKEPKTGLRFVEETADNPAQINTYSWPEDAHHWFPCYDYPNDKVTSEVIATVPGDYRVLSNGRLVEVTEDKVNQTRTFHWSQELPHASYSIMLAAGPFEVIQDSLGPLPISYWVYKKDVGDAPRSFQKTPRMVDFYNRTFGFAYPWAKYDQVCIAGFGGGMEDTTATTLGHGIIHSARADQDFPSDWLVAHELAHQWWGDLVTERAWSDVWISESFATYSEYLFSCYDRGPEEGEINLLGKKNEYLDEARTRYIRPVVFNRFTNPWEVMDGHSYPKGATILHMLRFILGDEAFFRVLGHFLKKHAFQVVDTHDFMIAVKEVTGQNLDWFFEQWIYKPGHPVFDVSYRWDERTHALKLKIVQTQDPAKGIPVYRTPVVIGVITPGKSSEQKIWLGRKEDEFVFDAPEKPLLVQFDKGNHLLKEWTFEKSLDELIYQVQNDDIIGRMWAASQLLRYKEQPAAIAALKESALQDPCWAARRSAVESLSRLRDSSLIKFFRQECQDKNSRVRVAAISALADLENPELVKFFKERFEKDDSYLVQAEAIKAVGKCGSSSDIPFLKKAAALESPREVIRRGSEAALKDIEKRS